MVNTVDQRLSATDRLARRARWIAVRGLASALTGLVVLGAGGRLVMFGSRLLHPEAVGRLTEGGNRIGEFTVEGTIALLLFGGLLSGAAAGVVWVFIRQWVPQRPVIVGTVAVALGASGLIDSGNRDFVILGDDVRIDLLLLVGLLFAFGAGLVPIDRWLDHLLPGPSRAWTPAYAIVVALGAPLTIPAFGSMVDEEFCFCAHPPVWTGVFFVLTAVATLWWWIAQMRGADVPSDRLRLAGRLGLSMGVVSGALYLTVDILRIL